MNNGSRLHKIGREYVAFVVGLRSKGLEGCAHGHVGCHASWLSLGSDISRLGRRQGVVRRREAEDDLSNVRAVIHDMLWKEASVLQAKEGRIVTATREGPPDKE